MSFAARQRERRDSIQMLIVPSVRKVLSVIDGITKAPLGGFCAPISCTYRVIFTLKNIDASCDWSQPYIFR